MTQPSFVQISTRVRSASTTNTTTLSAVSPGNWIFVIIGSKNRDSSVVPTDGVSIYELVDSFQESAFSTWQVAFYKTQTPVTTSYSPTITFPTGDEIDAISVEVADFKSIDTAATAKLMGTHWGTGTDTVTTGVLAQVDNAVISVAMGRSDIQAFNTLPAPSGFTLFDTANLGSGTPANSPFAAAYKLVSSTSAVAAAWAATATPGGNANPYAAMMSIVVKGGLPAPFVVTTSSANPLRGSTLTITGASFGASQGAGSVTIGGTVQTVTAWSATSISVTLSRGLNQYGVPLDLIVTDNSGVPSNTFVLTSIQPQPGWSFVNGTTPFATQSKRLKASPDLASENQVAYDNKGNKARIFSNYTGSVSPEIASMDCEAWVTGVGWGTTATQTFASTEPPFKATQGTNVLL